MVPGVIPNDVPPFGNLPHHIGIFFSGVANHKESGMHAIPLQNIQQPWGEVRMRSVVEREGS
jgi:hypothetical protein